jgi:hypothetical protein
MITILNILGEKRSEPDEEIDIPILITVVITDARQPARNDLFDDHFASCHGRRALATNEEMIWMVSMEMMMTLLRLKHMVHAIATNHVIM